MYRELPYLGPRSWGTGASLVGEVSARALCRASRLLARMALGVAGRAALSPEREPVLEFHGESGAPEGALYVDGVLVGTLVGVNRL